MHTLKGHLIPLLPSIDSSLYCEKKYRSTNFWYPATGTQHLSDVGFGYNCFYRHVQVIQTYEKRHIVNFVLLHDWEMTFS